MVGSLKTYIIQRVTFNDPEASFPDHLLVLLWWYLFIFIFWLYSSTLIFMFTHFYWYLFLLIFLTSDIFHVVLWSLGMSSGFTYWKDPTTTQYCNEMHLCKWVSMRVEIVLASVLECVPCVRVSNQIIVYTSPNYRNKINSATHSES